MKILFPYMARWSSAHASRYYHLLMNVAEMGHTVYVLQPPSRGSSEANDIDVVLQSHPNVHVITVEINKSFWSADFPMEKLIKKMYFSVKGRSVLRSLVKKERIDLIYVYNLPQFLYLIGKPANVVFDLADDLLGMLKTELSITERHPLYRLSKYCLEWMMRKSEMVICISGPLFETIHHPKKFLIPNGSRIKHLFESEPSEEKKKRVRPVVGYVGAFEYSMALDQAIDAAAGMPDVDFVLIGAGREFPRIQKKVNDLKLTNVTLTGALPHDKAMKIVSEMDICLNLFNKTDVSHAVSPLKLFEYLSLHRPVISTRLKEVERINKDFLYFADTVDELTEQIRYIIAHREEAAEKTQRGYEVTVTDFSWTTIAKNFIDAVYASTSISRGSSTK
ncbi:MAG: glycosyltransferase family protein [Bacteroidota bacterium]